MKLFLSLILSIPLFFAMIRDEENTVDSQSLAVMNQACESLQDVEKIVCLAETFKSTLNSTQLASLQLDYTLANAKIWSNLPASLSARIGLKMGTLSAVQLDAAIQLIKAATGTQGKEGFSEINQLWRADDYLGANGGGTTYGAGNFYIGFFGIPSMTSKWELQMTGHHTTISNTYENGTLKGGTPSFRASEPFGAFTYNNETHQPLIEEYNALKAMLAGLDANTLATAKLSGTFSDIVLGPNKDWVFPTVKNGVKCSTLNTTQKNSVIDAIKTYVQDVDDVSSKAIMDKYISEIDETYIAYAGNAALTDQRDYVRIDGPNVWIEYSVQRGIVLSPNHPHSIWRDRSFDYGGTGNPTSSTQNNDPNIAISVYPNPVATDLFIALDAPLLSDVTATIFDQTGKEIMKTDLNNTSNGNQNIKINVVNLPKGMFQCIVSYTNAGKRSKTSRSFIKI